MQYMVMDSNIAVAPAHICAVCVGGQMCCTSVHFKNIGRRAGFCSIARVNDCTATIYRITIFSVWFARSFGLPSIDTFI